MRLLRENTVWAVLITGVVAIGAGLLIAWLSGIPIVGYAVMAVLAVALLIPHTRHQARKYGMWKSTVRRGRDR